MTLYRDMVESDEELENITYISEFTKPLYKRTMYYSDDDISIIDDESDKEGDKY